MSAERWQRVRRLLEEARELPPTERGAFLTKACGGDTDLQAEVESLIAHGEGSADLLDRPPGESTLAEVPPNPRVERVGPYRIEREIGRGGMGSVFLATRDDDEFERRVALKLLHPGMVSDDIVRRFKNERQILAGIDHPNVAKLYDGGTTDDGLPYLVMEYIDGSRIDEYCDAHSLSIEKRLALFRKVCSAVHFAHQNLVIHRDLKPANILVTAKGEPKLLDFGIAKLLNPELAAATLGTTHADTRLLTPEYASPEQIKGEPITTASDVYALGVLLYRLLTGHSPYRLSGLHLHQLARVICETEPTQPSAVIDAVEEVAGAEGTTRITAASVAETREGSPEKLRRKLKGDLDNIVLMALRKEPTQRYSSVEQLSEDVRRFLGGLPVSARRGTFAYRTSKLVGRHRAALAGAATVLASLLGFTAFTVHERSRAEVEAAKSQAVVEFLEGAFKASDPFAGGSHEVTVSEALGRAVETLDGSFRDQPEIKAAVQSTIGHTYYALSKLDEAEPLLRSALEIRRRILGPEHPDVADSLLALAELSKSQGNYEEAEDLYRESLRLRRKIQGENHEAVAESLQGLAGLLSERGDYEEAERFFREALGMWRQLRGEEDELVAMALNNLAVLFHRRGDYEAAVTTYRETLALQRRVLSDEHPGLATTLSNLAATLDYTGEVEAAEPLYREALAMQRRLWGSEHRRVANTLHNLAVLLVDQGRYDEAEPLAREALSTQRKLLGDRHPEVAASLNNLATLSVERGELEAAVRQYAESLSILEESYGVEHWMTAETRSTYGACLKDLRRFPEAERLLLSAHPVLMAELGEEHERTRKTVRRLADLYQAWGKPEAEARFRSLLKDP